MIDSSTIQKAIEALSRALPGATIILFGSHGRGDAKHDSDIDFLVVAPDVKNCFSEMVRLSKILGKLLIPADVVVMSDDTFDKQKNIPNTLAYRAIREGKIFEPVP